MDGLYINTKTKAAMKLIVTNLFDDHWHVLSFSWKGENANLTLDCTSVVNDIFLGSSLAADSSFEVVMGSVDHSNDVRTGFVGSVQDCHFSNEVFFAKYCDALLSRNCLKSVPDTREREKEIFDRVFVSRRSIAEENMVDQSDGVNESTYISNVHVEENSSEYNASLDPTIATATKSEGTTRQRRIQRQLVGSERVPTFDGKKVIMVWHFAVFHKFSMPLFYC